MHRTLLLLLLAGSLILGCETIVDIDPPDYDPQLVVNSFFTQDSLWAVYLTRSIPVLDPEPTPQQRWVTDATIEVFQGSTLVDRLDYIGEGSYRARSHKPEPGQTYTLKVQAPGFATVEATDTIPEAARVLAVRTSDGGFHSAGFPLVRLQIDLADPPDQTDYYMLVAVAYDDIGNFFTNSFFVSDDPVLRRGEDLLDQESEFFSGRYFSDAQFPGETYTLTVALPRPGFSGFDQEQVLTLAKVSASFFDYNQTLTLQSDIGDNPFAEPVPIFSNVNGGLGIFAGFHAQEVIRLKRE